MTMGSRGGTAPDISGGVVVDSRRSWYALSLLTFSFALAYIDRQILNLLVDPIKQTLGITDTEFSFIQGTAFVVAYLFATPVFGRLVDVGNRRNILIVGVCIWSVCTTAAGFTSNYFELFLTRVGVGLSEACVFPVSMSLIGDYFSRKQMPRASSIFSLGSQLGSGFSLVGSGLVIAFAVTLTLAMPALAGFERWQMAFIVIGLPGLLFALLLLTIREPARGGADVTASGRTHLTMREVVAVLSARRKFYNRLYLSIGFVAVLQLGVAFWYPAYLIRAHGLAPSLTGYRLGTIGVIFGGTAPLVGTAISAWFERRGHLDAPLRASAWGIAASFLAASTIIFASSTTMALMSAAAILFTSCTTIGLITAAMQNATPARMRGVTGSLFTFSVQFFGSLIGPTVIALITDRVFGDPRMVGYSLEIVLCTAAALATLLLISLLPHYRAIMELPEMDAADIGAGTIAAPAAARLNPATAA